MVTLGSAAALTLLRPRVRKPEWEEGNTQPAVHRKPGRFFIFFFLIPLNMSYMLKKLLCRHTAEG